MATPDFNVGPLAHKLATLWLKRFVRASPDRTALMAILIKAAVTLALAAHAGEDDDLVTAFTFSEASIIGAIVQGARANRLAGFAGFRRASPLFVGLRQFPPFRLYG